MTRTTVRCRLAPVSSSPSLADVQIYKLSRPFILAADEVNLDHLGAFLARKLLQVEVRSGSKKSCLRERSQR